MTGDYLATEPFCTYIPPAPAANREATNRYTGAHAAAGRLSRAEVIAALEGPSSPKPKDAGKEAPSREPVPLKFPVSSQ